MLIGIINFCRPIVHFQSFIVGNNKWACDRCTKLQSRRRRVEGNGGSSSEAGGAETGTDGGEAGEDPKPKSTTVYSNASKQLLVFTPPAVLTIHLKRFQQTMQGSLRKVSRHVVFPMVLDLAPFCSATSGLVIHKFSLSCFFAIDWERTIKR